MPCSRETKITNCICVVFVLISGFLRLLLTESKSFSHNSAIFAFFAAAVIVWLSQLKKSLLRKDVLKNLTAMGLLMIFWMAIRTVKYEFLPDMHIAKRYIWYCYYIPMMLIPLLMFLSVLYIGLSEEKRISWKWNLLYIPTVLLLAGILTNDIHQRAFYFYDGLANWNEENILRGPVYYAAILWMAVLFLAAIATVFYRCTVMNQKKRILLPSVPLLMGAAYTICIISGRENIVTDMLTAPEIGCFLFAAFMECLILARLFPSNDNYGDFWNAAEISAGIMDAKGVVRYQSYQSPAVSEEQVRAALRGDILVQNGSAVLRSQAVQGGISYWVRDLSEINRLNCALEDLGDVLAEENAMMKAENDLAESWSKIDQQNKLYDDVAKSVKPQLYQLMEMLEELPKEEEPFVGIMKNACILNSYVKRHSNILLLCSQRKYLDGNELRMAVSESLEYTAMSGVKTYGSYRGEGLVFGETILMAYEVFEAVLESAVPGAEAILVHSDTSGGKVKMRIEISRPREYWTAGRLEEKISAFNGTLKTELEEETEYISLFLPAGGETR
ncbi:MAG: hypothetical protein ACI4CC_06565 [Lachnospiraceae bacterium]